MLSLSKINLKILLTFCMCNMEYFSSVLKKTLSNSTLDKMILASPPPLELSALLDIKKQRLAEGLTSKLDFTINPTHLIENPKLLELGLTTSTKTLEIALEVLNYQPEPSLRLLTIITKFCNNGGLDWGFLPGSERIPAHIVRYLEALPNLTELVDFLENYLKVCTAKEKDVALKTVFNLAKGTLKLEIVCMLHYFYDLKSREFEELIAQCLASTGPLQKQGIFLLSKSVVHSSLWENYFILLEAANEKQLHLIEPSLLLLSSVLQLPAFWRICLYKKLLIHPQHSIAYTVAEFILENEGHSPHFFTTLPDLLTGINRHEFNAVSQRFYTKLRKFTSGLSNDNIANILREGLKINFTPVALWSYCNSVFPNNFQVPLSLLEEVLRRVKDTPNLAIRRGCITLILRHLNRNFNEATSVTEILKFLQVVREYCDFNNIPRIVKIYKEQFTKMSCSLQCKDLNTVLLLGVSCTEAILENYIIQQMENFDDGIEMAEILLLVEQCNTHNLTEKALNILISKKSQRHCVTIAFHVISHSILIPSKLEQYKAIIDVHKVQICENFASNFVELLTKVIDLNPDYSITAYTTIKEILMSESTAKDRVFYNFPRFMYKPRAYEELTALACQEFLDVYKTQNYEVITQFIRGVFRVLPATKLLEFLSKLLEDNNEKVLEVISKCFVLFGNVIEIEQFVGLIIDFILYGRGVNKNEMVKYLVGKEIQDSAGIEYNRRDLRIRINGLETLLVTHSANTDKIALFEKELLKRYNKNVNKRYFPDSPLHLEKLRIIQALILIKESITNKQELIELIINIWLMENHQQSVKNLLQFLLINILKENDTFDIVIKAARNLKSLSLIPLLPKIVNSHNVDEIIDILLPWTMGPQFKLRLYSQVALLQIVEKFRPKYDCLGKSLTDVITGTLTSIQDHVRADFFEYVAHEDSIFKIIYWTIPKETNVTILEWGGLYNFSKNNELKNGIQHLKLEDIPQDDVLALESSSCLELHSNIQRKITPWRDLAFDKAPSKLTNFLLVTSLIEKASNLGGLCRTCEIFKVKQFILKTSKITSDKEFKSLSMSSENWMDVLEVKIEDLPAFFRSIKLQNYALIGAEQTSESLSLEQFKFPEQICLVLGNERAGIPPDLIPFMDHCVEIPQLGMVRSLNVHVAGAIIIWEYFKQHVLPQKINDN